MRGRGADPLPRALAVVALVAVAAVALQGRQGLDWDELAEPLDVQWSRLVVGVVLLVAMAALTRRALRRLRRPRRPARQEGVVEPEGAPIPWYLRVLAGLLVLGTLSALFWVLSSLGPIPRPPQPPGPESADGALPGGTPDRLGDGGSSTAVLVVVVGALLVAALGARWFARRRPDPEVVAEEEEHAEVRRLVAAVDAAEEELARHADPRAAVLAAYAAMARHLSTGIVRRGGQVPGSDTASELLDRSVSVGLVTRGPAQTLTELFREARFSSHPMGEDARRTAENSLAQVRDELAARRG